jgi:hypothetical protein
MEPVVWLDQHWTPNNVSGSHADQGTQTFGITYEWFIALEQPSLSFTAPGLLRDPAYLDRYGFIPSIKSDDKFSLPIGFAHGGSVEDSVGVRFINPNTKAAMSSLGLTCAACHTGRFTYGKTTVLVDGAPALINIQKFQKAIGLSIIYTRCQVVLLALLTGSLALALAMMPNHNSTNNSMRSIGRSRRFTIWKKRSRIEPSRRASLVSTP